MKQGSLNLLICVSNCINFWLNELKYGLENLTLLFGSIYDLWALFEVKLRQAKQGERICHHQNFPTRDLLSDHFWNACSTQMISTILQYGDQYWHKLGCIEGHLTRNSSNYTQSTPLSVQQTWSYHDHHLGTIVLRIRLLQIIYLTLALIQEKFVNCCEQ